MDIPVGRFPADPTKASEMFLIQKLNTNKKALIASEYLHSNWLSILLYFGGGMWNGKTISKTLESQGYNVTRLVEYRSKNIDEFISQFTPTNINKFLLQAKRIEDIARKLLGKTISNVIYKSTIVLKGMDYAEQVLEMYLFSL